MAGVVALCLAGVVAAQPGAGQKEGAIVGQVFEADLSAPIEYANVVLRALPESTQVTGTVTDKNGAFRLDGVKPGRYRVFAVSGEPFGEWQRTPPIRRRKCRARPSCCSRRCAGKAAPPRSSGCRANCGAPTL